MVAFPKQILSLAFVSHQQHTRETIVSVGGTTRRREAGGEISRSTGRHQDEDGNCVFGTKSYWDDMYKGNRDSSDEETARERKTESFSWYCGWEELQPLWSMLVPNRTESRVLVAGIGNDPAPVKMYDAGWQHMTAFDYSQAGVDRSKVLFGKDRHVKLLTADARNLPLPDASIDATLDKGTLDAIYITGKDVLIDSVKELTRVTAEGGVVVCISRVIIPDELRAAFDSTHWENVHDGSLAFALDGEATIDLGAELYSWRRTAA